MTDLKYRPQNLMSFLSFVGSVLGVLHLITEFEEGVFNIVKAIRWGFAITRRTYRWHFLLMTSFPKWFDVAL